MIGRVRFTTTISGRRVSLPTPNVTEIHIPDIAHSLSLLNRYTGHTSLPYSVAQHCLAVGDLVRIRGGSLTDQLEGYIHDAAEYIVNDVSTQVKHDFAPGLVKVEAEVQRVIRQRFRLFGDVPEIVKECDEAVFVAEAYDLFYGPSRMHLLSCVTETARVEDVPKIEYDDWRDVEREYLHRLYEYAGMVGR